VAAGLVHEERQCVGRPRRLGPRDGRGGNARGRVGLVLDLDCARVELCAQLGYLFRVEVVLGREGLQLLLGDRSALLDFLEEGPERCLNGRRQFSSLLL